MSIPDFNPYAPPQATSDAPTALPAGVEGGLPPGVRRFRLDPALQRVHARRRVLRSMRVIGPVMLVMMYGVTSFASGPAGANLSPFITLFVVGFFLLRVWVGVARRSSVELVSYELLVGPRVLRRMLAETQPAEVLRPEVTSIVELEDGLFVCCDSVKRSLYVTRALAGYEDVKAALEEWKPIEPAVGGWLAKRRRARREGGLQGTRDAVAGTVLAADASLVVDLEQIRNASSAAWRTFPATTIPGSGGLGRWKYVLLWVLLIVMFLAIWQVLQPGPGPHRDRDPSGQDAPRHR
ncbi:MAG: hypothetical protein ACRENE_17560 [Polyangiaceae bacterium]